jgi:hypothetical protein
MPSMVYQVRIKGHLPPTWEEEFGGLKIELEPDGTTLLSGALPDQAALHGILDRIRDLNLTLLSVTQITDQGEGV